MSELLLLSQDRLTENYAALRQSNATLDGETWSETDTRSKLIDTLLKDCLGWTEGDIRRELSDDKHRLDYLLSTNRSVLVIEAKKVAIALNVRHSTAFHKVKINTLTAANPDIKPLMEQAVRYAQKWSVGLAICTNGRTYIVFLANRVDGVPWKDGEAIVLSDVFHPTLNFSDLYQLLSRESVSSGRLETTLLGSVNEHPSQSVLSTYDEPASTLPKNALGLALEPLLQQVFSDVTREDSPEVLERCYVPAGSTTIREVQFESLLLDVPPSFAGASLSINSANAYRQFQDHIKDHLARQSWAHTIFVIGGLGVGKTMFLQRFFRVVSATDNSVRDQSVALFVDFRRPGVDPNMVPELIYERLYEQLKDLNGKRVPGSGVSEQYDLTSAEGLQQVFWSEVREFQDGPMGKVKSVDAARYEIEKAIFLQKLAADKHAFVRSAIRTLRTRYDRAVCIVLDNADQCEPKYQQAVYLYSRTLEAELGCLIIVSLREEWYWHFGKKGGPLDAYHDVVFHVPAPRARDVIAKRLDYAIELTAKYRVPSVTIPLMGGALLEAKHLELYLRSCKTAFFESDEISLFVECLANGAVRRGLSAFLEFVRSGHTKVDEYLQAFVTQEKYTLAFHQVFKSIAFGQYSSYSGTRSMVPNILISDPAVGRARPASLSRIRILQYLAARSGDETAVGRGFVPLSEVRKVLYSLGVDEGDNLLWIKSMFQEQLVEPDVKLQDATVWSYCRITALGKYSIQRLLKRFAYCEAVMLDTPIDDPHLFGLIQKCYVPHIKPAAALRRECVKKFVAWLEAIEYRESARVDSNGLRSMCPAIMTEVRAAIELEAANVV